MPAIKFLHKCLSYLFKWPTT